MSTNLPPRYAELVDEYSQDGIGWARFSPDKRMRYRLGRMLTPSLVAYGWKDLPITTRRVIFLMLNPSTADAFKLDPTVQKCCKFAQRWGAEVLEVVNLFAMRSPHPGDLDLAYARNLEVGLDELADHEIIAACTQPGVTRVMGAWGANGYRWGRDKHVRELLAKAGVKLEIFGLTQGGFPLHPLARGKSLIPIDREPVAWSPL